MVFHSKSRGKGLLLLYDTFKSDAREEDEEMGVRYKDAWRGYLLFHFVFQKVFGFIDL